MVPTSGRPSTTRAIIVIWAMLLAAALWHFGWDAGARFCTVGQLVSSWRTVEWCFVSTGTVAVANVSCFVPSSRNVIDL